METGLTLLSGEKNLKRHVNEIVVMLKRTHLLCVYWIFINFYKFSICIINSKFQNPRFTLKSYNVTGESMRL